MSTPEPFLSRHRHAMLAIFTVCWLGAVLVTHIRLPRFPSAVDVGDKWLHMIGFAGLTTLFVLTLLAYRRGRVCRLVAALTALPLYATVDELTQPWFHRSCDIHDWYADMIGMLITLAVLEGVFIVKERLQARSSGDSQGPQGL